jgi:hypothetical protein
MGKSVLPLRSARASAAARNFAEKAIEFRE